MNSKILIIFIAISILFGLIIFVVTQNLICSISIILISILFFIFICYPQIKKYLFKVNRYHACYSFINTFIISLSIKGTLSFALNSSIEVMDDNIKEIINGVNEINDKEKILYFKKIFPFDVYTLFTEYLEIWENEGGDVLSHSQYLINETSNIEEYINISNGIIKRNFLEFTILWTISLGVLLILRFSLYTFYDRLIKQIIFIFGVGLVFIFLLLTIEIFLYRAKSLKIGGYDDKEKYI